MKLYIMLLFFIKSMEGIGYNNYNIIFSRIHDDKIGMKKAKDLWTLFKNLDSDISSEETINDVFDTDPIMIFYSGDIAVADYYPVHSVNHFFSKNILCR